MLSWYLPVKRFLLIHLDVRFRNQGLDLIEVQDNGLGIASNNHGSVALKHHTSKLSTYADIAALQTFGFRGEALASLCALSVLTVTTCVAADAPKGSKLTFETSGRLNGTSIVAAQRGTTVSVENLFRNLPVRRRELERNIKREWHKVIALLNQYACILTNVKFSVSQQPTKGKKILLFSTKSNENSRDNIINIFGARAVTTLVELDLELEMQPTRSTIDSNTIPSARRATSKYIKIVGHVSRPSHGAGRQTPDRQMFFVNGRPCGLPQFAKTFNEVYKSYNNHQSPFIFADIRLDTHMYDVNVSPDKRSILLHDQDQLLGNLRASLTGLFDAQEYTLPASRMMGPKEATSAETTLLTPTRNSISAQKAVITDTRSPELRTATQHDIEAVSSEDQNPHLRSRILPSKVLRSEGRNQTLISRWARGGETELKSRHQPRPASEPVDEDVSASDSSETSSSNPDRARHQQMDEAKEQPEESLGMVQSPHAIQQQTLEISQPMRSKDQAKTTPTQVVTNAEAPIPALRVLRLHAHAADQSHTISSQKYRLPEPTVIIGDEVSLDNSPPPGKKSVNPRVLGDQQKPSFGGQLQRLFCAGGGADNCDAVNNEARGPTEDAADGTSQSDDVESGNLYEPEAGGTPANPKRRPPELPLAATNPSSSSPVEENDASDGDTAEGLESNSLGNESRQNKLVDQRPLDVRKAGKFRDATLNLDQNIRTDERTIQSQAKQRQRHQYYSPATDGDANIVKSLDAPDAESQLSLIISKEDFAHMEIVGQFNLGFILATRPGTVVSGESSEQTERFDELFIIDQHASDEKYNFERLQHSTILQSQRMVNPKRLELTAWEEEVVLENLQALEANGFKVEVDDTGDWPVGSRCQVTALPLSRETIFSLTDLEELISLLGEESLGTTHVPRPSKVRKLFAMRACRSSIMIGKGLNRNQMSNVIRHMGDLNKPWNCPHGRPTMRHLCRLQAWDEKGWNDDGDGSCDVNRWEAFLGAS